jgi:Fe-S-cluster containining protein
LCSIYSIRPSVCRKAHSLSVKACETGASLIPQNLTRVVQCEALSAGTNEAFKRVGLPASRHELSAAVLAALAENAEEAWYQGKPLLTHSSGRNR